MFIHKVYNNKNLYYQFQTYNSKVYMYLSLYATVLPVKCSSIITFIPPKNTASILMNSKSTEVNHPNEC